MIADRHLLDYEDQLSRKLFPGRCLPLNDAPFEGRLTVRRIGGVLATEVQSSAHVLDMRESPRERRDVVYATLVVEGQAILGQCGRWLQLKGGDAAISLATEPFTIICTEAIHLMSLKLPIESFIGSHLQALTEPVLIPRKAGAARFDQQGLARDLHRWLNTAEATDAQEARILSTIEGLLQLERQPGPGRSQYLAALAHISANLEEPDLSVAKVAQALGISGRHLSRIFSDHETTVASEIAERRLKRANAALRDVKNHHLSVAEIGRRSGFEHPESFSRAFRRKFGLSPRAARKRGWEP